MSTPYMGCITMYAFNYAPKGWAMCNGQLLPIQQNQALFVLLGTTYGGNGTTTFGLPDYRGRTPVHFGSGENLPTYTMGESGGVEQVTLTVGQLPPHAHIAVAVNGIPANELTPAGTLWGDELSGTLNLYSNANPNNLMSLSALASVGGNQPHPNMQPSIALNFCIALTGLFPSRN